MDLHLLHQELQISLEQGWKEFKASQEFEAHEEYFKFVRKSGFYETKFQSRFPSPIYDSAAKALGKLFLDTARRLGIHFDDIFPGNFLTSKEYEVEDMHVRKFFLTAYQKKTPLCKFSLTFYHEHDKFDFPKTPKIKIEEIYE